MTLSPPGPSADPSQRGSHLDSWKEIAAYLKRDIRTVQRWEKLEGLPVHRHQHDERGTAYAYSAEIDRWLEQRRRREDAAPRPTGPRPRRLTLYYWGGAFAVGAMAFLMWAFAGAREQPRPLSVSSITFTPAEQFHEWGPEVALSPDGSTMAYSVRSRNFQLHLRRRDQLEGQPLPDTAPAMGPFFSPDGRWIGFFQNGVLRKIAVGGGMPVTVSGLGVEFLGTADWGADDQIVYANVTPAGTHGLYRVPAGGGAPALIAELDGQAEDTYWVTPQSIDNGAAVLCTVARTTSTGARSQVVVVTVATGERRVLVDDAKHGLYLGDGLLVYWHRESLHAMRFDSTRLSVSGPRVPAWDGVRDRVRFRSWAHAAGTLVYWPTLRDQRRLAWVDRSGKVEPLPLPRALYAAPRLSPDGQTIAFKISGEGAFADIWTYRIVDRSTAQLTFDGRAGAVAWTPDGSRLTIALSRGAGSELIQVRADGSGSAEPLDLTALLLPPGAYKQPRAWLRSGRTLLMHVAAQPSLWEVPLDGEPRPIRSGNLGYGQVSPDERWIVYTSGASGRREVYVAAFPAGQAQWKVSDGGDLPVWARSGRELFYRNGQDVMSVPVAPGETFNPGAPQLLFSGRYYEGEPGGPNYDVSLDGQRLLMVMQGSTEGPDRLNVVQGWKEEIERRLRAAR
jgi:eukaryotic-like serine/threonine-protein kinase